MGKSGDSREPTSLVGQRINGTYEVLREIATGGMSHVYLGRHVVMDREVAIKVLRTDLPPDSDGTAMFLQEVRATSQLTHPNNITVYEFGQTDEGDIFLVMEFITGQSLSALLAAKGRLEFNRIARILVQICGALAEAHAAGIVHRDLKPDNIMIEEQRHGVRDFVTLLDFGIAHRTDRGVPDEPDTMDEVFTGTPEYTSPEQALGKPVDARSDVYALGILLYLLISGRVPFSAGSPLDTLIRQLKEPPPPIPVSISDDLPFGLTDLLDEMLAKKPEDRPASCVEVRNRLVGVLNASHRRPTTSLPAITVELVVPPRTRPISRPLGATAAREPGADAPTPEPTPEPKTEPLGGEVPLSRPASPRRPHQSDPSISTLISRPWATPTVETVDGGPGGGGGAALVACRSARSCYRAGTRNLPMAVRWIGPNHVGFVIPSNDDLPDVGALIGLLVPAAVVGIEVMWVEGRVTSRVASTTGRGHAVLVELDRDERPSQWASLADHWLRRAS